MPQKLTSVVTLFVSQHIQFYLLTGSVYLQCMLWMKPAQPHIWRVCTTTHSPAYVLGIIEVNQILHQHNKFLGLLQLFSFLCTLEWPVSTLSIAHNSN